MNSTLEEILNKIVIVLLAFATYFGYRWALLHNHNVSDSNATGFAVVAALMIWGRYAK